MRALPRPMLALLVAAPLALAGCTHAGDKPHSTQPGYQPTAVTTNTATVTPTGTPTETATGSPSAPPPQTLANRLVPTTAVPALDPQRPWQDGEIKPGTLAPDVCSRGSLLDIGATDALVRTYFPGDDSDDLAQEAVAEFPDAKTAATAWDVLASFRDHCRSRLTKMHTPQVGALTSLPVTAGEAAWYLVTGQVPGEETPRTYVIGMVKVGTRIAITQVFTTRPGITVAAMRAPTTRLLTAVAGLLG